MILANLASCLLLSFYVSSEGTGAGELEGSSLVLEENDTEDIKCPMCE